MDTRFAHDPTYFPLPRTRAYDWDTSSGGWKEEEPGCFVGWPTLYEYSFVSIPAMKPEDLDD